MTCKGTKVIIQSLHTFNLRKQVSIFVHVSKSTCENGVESTASRKMKAAVARM